MIKKKIMGRDKGRLTLSVLAFILCTLYPVGTVYPVSSKVFDVAEMLGEVTDSSAQIFTQIGLKVTPELYFKLGYDSSSHASDQNYAFETPNQTEMSDGDKLEFRVGGLRENTKYYYSIAYRQSSDGEWIWRPERHFHTSRNPGRSFRFCVLADFHYDHTFAYVAGLNLKNQIGKNVEADEPDFVVALGDMNTINHQGAGGDDPIDCDAAYSSLPSLQTQEDSDAYHETFASMFLELFAHSSMLVWVNGNHEGLSEFLNVCPRFDYTLKARMKYIPVLNHDEPNAFFGDFVWGDVHIIWLDPLAFVAHDPLVFNDPTGYVLGPLQKEWLSETLAGSTSKWKLIFAHSLFGGAGPSFECNPGSSYARGNANFVNNPGTDQIYIQSLMETYGVNGYFYGHDHLYSVSEYNDVKYILAGAGQRNIWIDCIAKYFLPWPVIAEVGHLRVDVHPKYLAISYIKGALDESNGEVLDLQYIY